MADEKNQNDAVQDVLARLRRQMNQFDEVFGSGSLTSSPAAPACEDTPTVETNEAASDVAIPVPETCEDGKVENGAPTMEEEDGKEAPQEVPEAEEPQEEPAEASASEKENDGEPPAAEAEDLSEPCTEQEKPTVGTVEQLDIFDTIEESEAPLQAEALPAAEDDSRAEEGSDGEDTDDEDADDMPVFVREDAPVYVRKAQIVPELPVSEEPAPVAPIVVTLEDAAENAAEDTAEDAAEDAALTENVPTDRTSVFVPNGKSEPQPRIASDSIFSPERRFDPSRYDAMLAAYERTKAERVPAPSEPSPKAPAVPVGRPVLNPVPEMPAYLFEEPAEASEEPSDEAEALHELAYEWPIVADEPSAPVPENPVPTAQENEEASAAPLTEAAPDGAPIAEDPLSSRVFEAPPELRERELAARDIPFSDRVVMAPREYRVDDDYVREPRASRSDDGDDFMSDLPESIRGHLVGSPLGHPSRVVNLREEYAEPPAAKKEKRVKRTKFREELVDKNEDVSRHRLDLRLKQEVSRARVRLLIIVVLSFVLLLLENIPFVPGMPEDFVEAQTAGILNALLLLGVAIAAWPRLSVGLDGIRIGRILPESILLVETVLAIVYSVVFGILKASVGYFSFVPALGICVLYTFLSFRYETKRRVLEKLDAEEEKHLLSPVDSKIGAEEKRALSEMTGERNASIYRIRRARTVDGVSHRLSRVCEDERLNFALLILLLCVGVVSLLITFFLKDSVMLAARTALFSSFLTVPAVMMCGAHAFPMCRADRAAGEDGAIVGETTVYEATEIRAVSFEDVAAAPSSGVRLSGVRVYCNDPATVFKYLTALYNYIGGPLRGRFSGMYSQKRTISLMLVRLVDATKDGVSAEIDGAEVVVGNGQHMLDYGITPAYDATDERVLPGGKCGVLYVAINGMICMKFYIEHGISPEFVHDVKRLNRVKIAAILRTYDPNLNEKTLARSALRGMPVTTVSKKKDECEDSLAERAPGGIVSLGKREKLLPLLLLCFRVRGALRAGWGYKLVGAILGGCGAILLSVLGIAGLLPSAFPALYQLVWLGGYLLYAALRIKLPDMTKEK